MNSSTHVNRMGVIEAHLEGVARTLFIAFAAIIVVLEGFKLQDVEASQLGVLPAVPVWDVTLRS